jgi:hypothetical protein
MPMLKATRELRYAGVTLMPGDTFDASDKDARVLKAIKKAEDASEAKPRTVDLPAKAMKATEAPAEPEAPLSGNQYMRRDMQAVGQTGEAISAPSSRRGRPPTRPVSEDSGE